MGYNSVRDLAKAMDKLIGQVLHNRYRIQSLLGRQTGRRTFLASDLQTGLSVVIKLLLFGPDFTWDDLKLFEREAEVLKSLAHPAIPQYLDCFEAEVNQWQGFALVQTYLEAKSLQNWIQSGRTFSEEELKAIAKQLLLVMDYLHNRQPAVVHRDIKPSNILLSDRSGNSTEQMYLIDFGSVQTAVHGGTMTIVGTYGYMPPEQFSGQTTPTSDLYALGATLIYLATGQHPDQLPQRKMHIHFEDQVNLSPHFIDWLKWMTEPGVDLRLKSANQALEALEKSDLRKSSLTIATKPNGSKVRVRNTEQMLEILIQRWNTWGVVSSFLCVLFLGLFVKVWFSGGSLFPLFFLIICIWSTIPDFGERRLRITQSEISMSRELLGLRYWTSTAARQDIVKVELTRPSHRKDSEGGIIHIPAQINIWAGTKPFVLGGGIGMAVNGRRASNLTAPELDWLAQVLSSWLDLPIT
jgi:serine/threonine protein kinase